METKVRLAAIIVVAILALGQSGYGSEESQWGGEAMASQPAKGTTSHQSDERATQGLSPIAAYKDYLIRSQVTEGLVLAEGPEIALEVYYSDNKRWPQSNAQAGLAPAASQVGKYVSSVDVGVHPGTIVVTYGRQEAAAPIHGKILALSGIAQGGSIAWSCHNSMTTIPAKYLPSSCNKASK